MIDELGRRRLIEAWRANRVAARELAEELGGFEHVADWLNSNLTDANMIADFRALGVSADDVLSMVDDAEADYQRSQERNSGV